jgi:hypothetical protein
MGERELDPKIGWISAILEIKAFIFTFMHFFCISHWLSPFSYIFDQMNYNSYNQEQLKGMIRQRGLWSNGRLKRDYVATLASSKQCNGYSWGCPHWVSTASIAKTKPIHCQKCGSDFCAHCISKCKSCSKQYCKKCVSTYPACLTCKERQCCKSLSNCKICQIGTCSLCSKTCVKCKTTPICKNCTTVCDTCQNYTCKNCVPTTPKCEACNDILCCDPLRKCSHCSKEICPNCYQLCVGCNSAFCNDVQLNEFGENDDDDDHTSFSRRYGYKSGHETNALYCQKCVDVGNILPQYYAKLTDFLDENGINRNYICQGTFPALPIITVNDYVLTYPCTDIVCNILKKYCNESPVGIGQNSLGYNDS